MKECYGELTLAEAQAFDEWLTEDGFIHIGSLRYPAGKAFEAVDPIVFNIALREFQVQKYRKRKRRTETMKKQAKPIRFIVAALQWRDRKNGNTYFSARITRCKDQERLFVSYRAGYEKAYQDEARKVMVSAGWLAPSDDDSCVYYHVSHGLKREVVAWGKGGGLRQ